MGARRDRIWARKSAQSEPGEGAAELCEVCPMSNLADMLKNPNAYRSACADLCAGALRLTPQELADLTLQVAGQSPQRARQIVAEHLSKAAAGATPKPPAPPSVPPQPPGPPQPVAHVQHLPPAPQLDLPAKPPTPKFEGGAN